MRNSKKVYSAKFQKVLEELNKKALKAGVELAKSAKKIIKALV